MFQKATHKHNSFGNPGLLYTQRHPNAKCRWTIVNHLDNADHKGIEKIQNRESSSITLFNFNYVLYRFHLFLFFGTTYPKAQKYDIICIFLFINFYYCCYNYCYSYCCCCCCYYCYCHCYSYYYCCYSYYFLVILLSILILIFIIIILVLYYCYYCSLLLVFDYYCY